MLAYTPTPEEQIREFDKKGYLIVRNVLDSATLSKLEQASDRLIDSDLETNRQTNPTGLYDGFRNTLSLDDAYLPLLTHPTILPLVIHLLGSNIPVSYTHLTLPTNREV